MPARTRLRQPNPTVRRVLFLTPELPYPPESGGRIKSLSLLEYMRSTHDVRVLCFRRSELSEEQTKWAERYAVRTLKLVRGRNPLNLLRSYLSGVPLSIQRNRSGEMRRLVQAEVSAWAPEVVFVDGWLMAQYLPAGFDGLKLLHEHNAEHTIWRRQWELERNPLLRFLVGREFQRVRRHEAAMLKHYDVVFAVSEADREALLALGAGVQIRVLPNLPDESLLDLPPLAFTETEPLIFYFGTLSWQPNIEGLEFFLQSVLPEVREDMPEARLVIAGNGASPALVKLAGSTAGVDFVGPIDDPELYYRRARVFIEATRSGGGTKLKVLNALARGLPVVASPQAARGLDAVAGEHLLVARGSDSMIEAVLRVLRDQRLWTRLSENGRALVRARYRAKEAYAPLDEVLNGAAART